MKQTEPPAAMREREELQSEAYSVLHHLWGEWREGTAYSQAIKDKWGRLLFLTQKLEDSRQAAQPSSEKIEAGAQRVALYIAANPGVLVLPSQIAAILREALGGGNDRC